MGLDNLIKEVNDRKVKLIDEMFLSAEGMMHHVRLYIIESKYSIDNVFYMFTDHSSQSLFTMVAGVT
jgi:hypothetical protein